MDLVEHDVLGLVDDGRTPEQHVPLYFSSHDDAQCVRVDGHITCHQAYLVFAEDEAEFAQFLVGQGFDRRGLNDPLVVFESKCYSLDCHSCFTS